MEKGYFLMLNVMINFYFKFYVGIFSNLPVTMTAHPVAKASV